jgi:hypothetical protein
MAQGSNSGLTQRGLLLFGLMTAAAFILWVVLWRTPEQTLPMEKRQPELIAALTTAPASLPAVPWGPLVQVSALLPSAPGWEIRYNATVTLARRGSPQLPLDILAEMLDEGQQMKNFRARLQDGREVPDETAARRTVLQALKAVLEWHKHASALRAVGPDHPGLQKVHAAIVRLTQSPNLVVKTEAENTRLALPKRAS